VSAHTNKSENITFGWDIQSILSVMKRRS